MTADLAALIEAVTTLFGERLDTPLHATTTLPQHSLGLLLGVRLFGSAFELGAELFPAPLPLLLAPLSGPAARSKKSASNKTTMMTITIRVAVPKIFPPTTVA
jgi:hypothetical protein